MSEELSINSYAQQIPTPHRLTLFRPNNEINFVFWGKNMSNIEIFSIIVCTFAMSLMILLVLICSTKVSEISGTYKEC